MAIWPLSRLCWPLTEWPLTGPRNAKIAKNIFWGTYIKKHSGLGESNIQSENVSFCLVFRAFWKLLCWWMSLLLCRYLLEYLIYHLRPFGLDPSSHPKDDEIILPQLWKEGKLRRLFKHVPILRPTQYGTLGPLPSAQSRLDQFSIKKKQYKLIFPFIHVLLCSCTH